MIKSELVQRIAELRPDLYIRDVDAAVNCILEEIASTLEGKGRVELRGFCTLSVKLSQPRKSRNPRTGDPVEVGPKVRPVFKMGKEMRALLNQQRAN